jgi:hypothetical protein
MWVGGVLTLFLFSCAVLCPYAFRDRGHRQLPTLWDVPTVASAFAELCGSLAALSLAAAVFIGTLSERTGEFEASIGFFVIAFLVLVAAAMQFGATPNSRASDSDEFRSAQSISYVVAASSFYLGLGMTWLGLRLLLLALELETAADILTWVLFVSIIAGALRIAMNLYRHTDVPVLTCALVVVVAIAGAAFYRLVLVAAWDDLWPARDEPLWLSTVAFGTTVVGYAYQTFVLATYGERQLESIVTKLCQPLLALYTMNVIQTVALVWLAVVEQ